MIEQQQFADLAVKHNLALSMPGIGDIDLSTDDGEFMATLGAALARKEVRRKAARQKDAHKQMVTTVGRPWWPARPFGYDADPHPLTKKWWTIQRDPASKQIIAVNEIRRHKVEAKLVKRAYNDFLSGTKLYEIAAAWNEKGVAPPRGKKWSPTQVRLLLLAPRNAGLREYEGKEYPGTWPAIVDPDTWREAVRTLQNPQRRCGVDRGRKHLLSGIARCGRSECGAALTSTVNSRGVRQYVCIACNRIVRGGEKLDQLVIERVVWRLSREDAVDLLKPPVDEVDANALRKERKKLTDRLVQLGTDFASAPPEFTRAAVTEIQTRLDEISEQLTDPGKARIYEGVIGAKDVRKAYVGLDLGRRRAIVDALLAITVNPVGKGTGSVFDPGAIDIAWKA